jgi:transposase
MVRPLSNDLRKRVVAAVSKGESCRSAALRFGVAVSSVVKWSQRYRATGSVKPAGWAGSASLCWIRMATSSRSGSGRPRI